MRTREERMAEMTWILDKMPEPHEDVVGAVVVFLYDDGQALTQSVQVSDEPALAEAVEKIRAAVLSTAAPPPGPREVH